MSTCIFVLFVTLNVVDCGGTFYCELVKMLWPNNQATTSNLSQFHLFSHLAPYYTPLSRTKKLSPLPTPVGRGLKNLYNSGLDVSLYCLTLISILQVIVLHSFKVKFVKTIVLLIIFKNFLWNVKYEFFIEK